MTKDLLNQISENDFPILFGVPLGGGPKFPTMPTWTFLLSTLGHRH